MREKLAENLEVGFRSIAIGPATLQHFRDIDQPQERHDITYENAQARERTQILMDLANQVNGLVIGTGDLSELAPRLVYLQRRPYVHVRRQFRGAQNPGALPGRLVRPGRIQR